MKTGIVVLAAGSSSRMGSPKQLLAYRGKPLLRHAVETALASACGPVIVVLGSNASTIAPSLYGLDVQIISNPLWEQGMGSSIHAGVRAAQGRALDAVILTVADQPLLTPDTYRRLAAGANPIVTSEYSDTVGVPVLFTAAFFPHLLALAPDQGCKKLILSNPDATLRIPCPEAALDLDTPSDLGTDGRDSCVSPER